MTVRNKSRNMLTTILTYAVIVVVLVVFWTPIYYGFILSFVPFMTIPDPKDFVPFLHFQPSLDGWQRVFGLWPPGTVGVVSSPEFTFKCLTNSVVTATGSSILCLAIGSFAAYALARFRFERWKNSDISFFIISQRFLPAAAFLIPWYLTYSTLGLVDTLQGLILAHTYANLPLTTWLLRDYFLGIPVAMEEAALIDGCSRWQVVFRIVFPLCLPGLVTVFLLTWLFSWNELIFAVTFSLYNAKTYNVILAGIPTIHAIYWCDVGAMAALGMLPPLILAAVTQRYIIRGLSLGALKF